MIKNRIKEYRVRFDMKQEELASKVGVRRETIGVGRRIEGDINGKLFFQPFSH